jgi:sugar lactone lactonase YvrE
MRELTARELTKQFGFTQGIEGPACDREGNIYAVNYAKMSTIGRITPDGTADIFVELPDGCVGSGIRFNRAGEMLVADYASHNILKINMRSRTISIYAHEPRMNQPNDIAITKEGVLFASDPNWRDGTGQLWRIDTDGTATLLETGMGTTNGIEVGPCEDVLYVNETVQRKIWAYDLNANGEISHKRLLIEFQDYMLDGMRCDMAGNIYVTRYGKGVIAQISPDGDQIAEFPLLGKDCTNLTFGGPEGKHLYTTVADTGNIQFLTTDIPGRCWNLWRDAD